MKRRIPNFLSNISDPRSLATGVIAVAIVGTAGSFVGRWWWFIPAASFGNAGDWVAGAAGAAVVLNSAHQMTRAETQMARARTEAIEEKQANLRKVLQGGYRIGPRPRRVPTSGNGADMTFNSRLSAWEDRVRLWAADILMVCPSTGYESLRSMAKLLSAAESIVSPHFNFNQVEHLTGLLQEDNALPDLKTPQRSLNYTEYVEILEHADQYDQLSTLYTSIIERRRPKSTKAERANEAVACAEQTHLPDFIKTRLFEQAEQIEDSEKAWTDFTNTLKAIRVLLHTPPKLWRTHLTASDFDEIFFTTEDRRISIREVFPGIEVELGIDTVGD